MSSTMVVVVVVMVSSSTFRSPSPSLCVSLGFDWLRDRVRWKMGESGSVVERASVPAPAPAVRRARRVVDMVEEETQK
jgi:hypothetical protein